ncbi:MAG: recombinase family protein, partial [Planctomycetes bacterium]|nr:recombinase family protein [Planctomycetota bacterium]
MPKIAVGYLRCSSDKQEFSIDDQRMEIQAYALRHGYKIIRWYTDDCISVDDNKNRHEFQRMIADANNKPEFTAILVWDQDRFGRFSPHEASYWTWPLSKAGVQLVTTNKGPIDWSDFTEWLTYSVNQHGKHEFLRDLSRNVTRGQLRASKDGSRIGCPPYAFVIEGKKGEKRLVHSDDSKVAVVRRVYKEYVEDGRSMRDIAKRLTADQIPSPKGGTWRFDSVRCILENPAYIGTQRFNVYSRSKYHHIQNGEIVEGSRRGRNPESDWIVTPNLIPPMIDKRTFDKAQTRLAKGKKGHSRYTLENNPFLLSCKLKCGRCGGSLSGMHHRQRRFYECINKDRYGTCEGTTVREDVILDYLVEQ